MGSGAPSNRSTIRVHPRKSAAKNWSGSSPPRIEQSNASICVLFPLLLRRGRSGRGRRMANRTRLGLGFERCDRLREWHRASVAVDAVTIAHGGRFRLFRSDDEHNRNLLELGVADLGADLFR